jgi:hypothetical protein
MRRHARGLAESLAYLLAALAIGACAAQDAQPVIQQAPAGLSDAARFIDQREKNDSSIDFTRYTTLHASEVRPLRLRPVGQATLGVSPEEFPSQVSDALILPDEIVVLDGHARKLRAFQRDGRSIFAVGKWGEAPGEMSSPRRLAVEGDTLVVLDATHDDSFSGYDKHGKYLGRLVDNLDDGGNLAVDKLSDTLYVATLPSDPEAKNPYVVRVLDKTGKLLARGCRRSPDYSASAARHGLIRAYGFVDLSAANGEVYCVQPISPIIQVLHSSGRLARTIDVAPPFYLPPHDIPETMNSKATQAFEATFTAQTRVFARKNGFLSVYEQFDSASGGSIYRLFGCESGGHGAQRCATAVSPGKPIRLRAPDTLGVVEKATGTMGPRLGFYRIQ